MTDFNVLPPKGEVVGGLFAFPVRVYYEDTDAGGIVYYANYLKFAERARTEFLRFLAVHQQQNLQEKQTGFVVRSCHIEYLKSAVLDDALTITCKVVQQSAASAIIAQEIVRGDEILASLEVKVIYMNVATHRPTRIPADMIEKFKQFNG